MRCQFLICYREAIVHGYCEWHLPQYFRNRKDPDFELEPDLCIFPFCRQRRVFGNYKQKGVWRIWGYCYRHSTTAERTKGLIVDVHYGGKGYKYRLRSKACYLCNSKIYKYRFCKKHYKYMMEDDVFLQDEWDIRQRIIVRCQMERFHCITCGKRCSNIILKNRLLSSLVMCRGCARSYQSKQIYTSDKHATE